MVENQVFPIPLIIKNITMELKYGERFASIAGGNIIKDVEFDSNVIK